MQLTKLKLLILCDKLVWTECFLTWKEEPRHWNAWSLSVSWHRMWHKCTLCTVYHFQTAVKPMFAVAQCWLFGFGVKGCENDAFALLLMHLWWLLAQVSLDSDFSHDGRFSMRFGSVCPSREFRTWNIVGVLCILGWIFFYFLMTSANTDDDFPEESLMECSELLFSCQVCI